MNLERKYSERHCHLAGGMEKGAQYALPALVALFKTWRESTDAGISYI
jgi:hypothetical protein